MSESVRARERVCVCERERSTGIAREGSESQQEAEEVDEITEVNEKVMPFVLVIEIYALEKVIKASYTSSLRPHTLVD